MKELLIYYIINLLISIINIQWKKLSSIVTLIFQFNTLCNAIKSTEFVFKQLLIIIIWIQNPNVLQILFGFAENAVKFRRTATFF